MLKKCTSVRATLLVPDVEDSVPVHEKPNARHMIAQYLPYIRDNAFSKDVVITPRTNAPSLDDLFSEDIKVLVTPETVAHIDGICVPKVDTVEDMEKVDSTLRALEQELGLTH